MFLGIRLLVFVYARTIYCLDVWCLDVVLEDQIWLLTGIDKSGVGNRQKIQRNEWSKTNIWKVTLFYLHRLQNGWTFKWRDNIIYGNFVPTIHQQKFEKVSETINNAIIGFLVTRRKWLIALCPKLLALRGKRFSK